jgi:hypothetical protein
VDKRQSQAACDLNHRQGVIKITGRVGQKSQSQPTCPYITDRKVDKKEESGEQAPQAPAHTLRTSKKIRKTKEEKLARFSLGKERASEKYQKHPDYDSFLEEFGSLAAMTDEEYAWHVKEHGEQLVKAAIDEVCSSCLSWYKAGSHNKIFEHSCSGRLSSWALEKASKKTNGNGPRINDQSKTGPMSRERQIDKCRIIANRLQASGVMHTSDSSKMFRAFSTFCEFTNELGSEKIQYDAYEYEKFRQALIGAGKKMLGIPAVKIDEEIKNQERKSD